MATVHIVLSRVSGDAVGGGAIPVPDSVGNAADTMTSSGTSAPSSATSTDSGQVWDITSTGNIWVKFGTNPTAASDDGWLILANVPRQFAVSTALEKVAIKDAA